MNFDELLDHLTARLMRRFGWTFDKALERARRMVERKEKHAVVATDTISATDTQDVE